MNRIVTLTIDGVEYPLLFSILAMEDIYDAYGSLEDMMNKVFDSPNVAKQLKDVFCIIGILNKAAIAYLHAKHQEGNVFDANEMIATVNPYDAVKMDLWGVALDAINKGNYQTVEVASNSKNAEATQG